MIVAAVLVAGGGGTRLGAGVPKAFVPLAGAPLYEHAVRRMRDHPLVDEVILVVPDGWVRTADDHLAAQSLRVAVVAGGATRTASVAAGLGRLSAAASTVLVHDVARPLVPAEVVTRVVDAVRSGAEAVVPVVPVSDSVRVAEGDGSRPIDRATLFAVQTPQGFSRAALLAGHAAGAAEATDDASLVEAVGYAVHLVPGANESFKITHPIDLLTAEALIARG